MKKSHNTAPSDCAPRFDDDDPEILELKRAALEKELRRQFQIELLCNQSKRVVHQSYNTHISTSASSSSSSGSDSSCDSTSSGSNIVSRRNVLKRHKKRKQRRNVAEERKATLSKSKNEKKSSSARSSIHKYSMIHLPELSQPILYKKDKVSSPIHNEVHLKSPPSNIYYLNEQKMKASSNGSYYKDKMCTKSHVYSNESFRIDPRTDPIRERLRSRSPAQYFFQRQLSPIINNTNRKELNIERPFEGHSPDNYSLIRDKNKRNKTLVEDRLQVQHDRNLNKQPHDILSYEKQIKFGDLSEHPRGIKQIATRHNEEYVNLIDKSKQNMSASVYHSGSNSDYLRYTGDYRNYHLIGKAKREQPNVEHTYRRSQSILSKEEEKRNDFRIDREYVIDRCDNIVRMRKRDEILTSFDKSYDNYIDKINSPTYSNIKKDNSLQYIKSNPKCAKRYEPETLRPKSTTDKGFLTRARESPDDKYEKEYDWRMHHIIQDKANAVLHTRSLENDKRDLISHVNLVRHDSINKFSNVAEIRNRAINCNESITGEDILSEISDDCEEILDLHEDTMDANIMVPPNIMNNNLSVKPALLPTPPFKVGEFPRFVAQSILPFNYNINSLYQTKSTKPCLKYYKVPSSKVNLENSNFSENTRASLDIPYKPSASVLDEHFSDCNIKKDIKIDFEEISDNELDESSRIKYFVDALGVDWASFVDESKYKSIQRSETLHCTSAKDRFNIENILLNTGLSLQLINSQFASELLFSSVQKVDEFDDTFQSNLGLRYLFHPISCMQISGLASKSNVNVHLFNHSRAISSITDKELRTRLCGISCPADDLDDNTKYVDI